MKHKYKSGTFCWLSTDHNPFFIGQTFQLVYPSSYLPTFYIIKKAGNSILSFTIPKYKISFF